MAGADWSSTITVNVTLSALPPARLGFGNVLLIVNQDDGNSLNAARVMSFSSYAEAQTANTAGYISAATLGFLQTAFLQRPTPSKVKVGYRDVGTAETWAAAITAIQAADADWYGLTIYSRVDQDIEDVSDAVSTLTKMFVAQGDDTSWLNATLPATIVDIDNEERTAVIFHDSDAEAADLAWAVSRLVFDPDERSAGWEGQILDIAALTTGLTSAQRDFIEANSANVGLPFSSATVYVSPGQNMNTRPIYEIVTQDWFKARVSEDIAYLKLQYTARGEKIIVDSTGQAIILAILNQRLEQGEDVGHFIKGQTRATAEAISAADISARRLRFKVEAQIAGDARLFVFNVYLQPEALQAV